MITIETFEIPQLDNVQISVRGSDLVKLEGTIATKDPDEQLGPFFRRIHDLVAAEGPRTLNVDVSGLTFVNSSAIRLFVDWATWIKKEPNSRRYELRFLTDRSITWQRTSFTALQSLAKDVVAVQSVNESS
jgi:hypothetical protein